MAVTNDLVADRRVQRHAVALREAGYVVDLVGRLELSPRARRGWRFYAEYNWRLWRRLRRSQADVVWANDTDTLPGCYLAARHLGAKLVMDAHELFPEVPELVHKPFVRWVWATLERCLMPRCDARLTVCQSLADYYHRRYGVDMVVVRNVSAEPPHPSTLTPPPSAKRTLLYQGAVNVGRGVDWAIDALQWLTDCQLLVVGGGDLLEQMQRYAQSKPWADRVHFTGRLAPAALERLTPTADVGLVMLEDMGLSYHYALPNRIGDFVAAGVPIVVSDLPEMAAVVRRFGVGVVMEQPGPRALAHAVQQVLARQWTDADFVEARRDMDWNKEKQKLINLCYTTFC